MKVVVPCCIIRLKREVAVPAITTGAATARGVADRHVVANVWGADLILRLLIIWWLALNLLQSSCRNEGVCILLLRELFLSVGEKACAPSWCICNFGWQHDIIMADATNMLHMRPIICSDIATNQSIRPGDPVIDWCTVWWWGRMTQREDIWSCGNRISDQTFPPLFI